MSYTSESVFRRSATLPQLREVVELLGFQKIRDGLRVPGRVSSYYWFEYRDYRSWVGVELDLYRSRSGRIKATTRSRAGRSYWDLIHQNRTLKCLRDLFGGHFTTDAGRNRYWRPDERPPKPAQSGCYLARARLHNAFIRARIYLSTRGLDAPIARPQPTGLTFIDEMNPRLLSNNLLLPYLVAIWEDFHKSCFAALLKYSPRRTAVLKSARLPLDRLEKVAAGVESVEDTVANTFSFQRPSTIAAAYRVLDPQFDFVGILRRPYRGRSTPLVDSLERVVESRHEFVHNGDINTALSDRKLVTTVSDFEAAADRVYRYFAEHYVWEPLIEDSV